LEETKREKAERLRYGRFFYRFPMGESGADVYNRMTMMEDELVLYVLLCMPSFALAFFFRCLKYRVTM
jgi:hypothetical protein